MKKGDKIQIKMGNRQYEAVVETPASGDQKLVVVLNNGEHVADPEVIENKKTASTASK